MHGGGSGFDSPWLHCSRAAYLDRTRTRAVTQPGDRKPARPRAGRAAGSAAAWDAAARQGARRAVPMEGHAVDASAGQADDGRGRAAKGLGERPPRSEPRMPEWSNPPAVMRGGATARAGGAREPGELKHLRYPEERT